MFKWILMFLFLISTANAEVIYNASVDEKIQGVEFAVDKDLALVKVYLQSKTKTVQKISREGIAYSVHETWVNRIIPEGLEFDPITRGIFYKDSLCAIKITRVLWFDEIVQVNCGCILTNNENEVELNGES